MTFVLRQLALLVFFALSPGCSLLVDFDRSQISDAAADDADADDAALDGADGVAEGG